MKKFIEILLAIFTIFAYSSCGTWERKIHPIPDDFHSIPYYQADKDMYLGKRGTEDADVLTGVYSIQGLPEEDFLYLEEYYITAPGGPPSITLYMREGAKEPIYKYLDVVEKVVVEVWQEEFTVENSITITNSDIWNSLLFQRKKGEKVFLPNIYPSDSNNLNFYFDLPCDLIWNTMLYFSDENKIYWFCGDLEDEQYIWYDVTSELKHLFID